MYLLLTVKITEQEIYAACCGQTDNPLGEASHHHGWTIVQGENRRPILSGFKPALALARIIPSPFARAKRRISGWRRRQEMPFLAQKWRLLASRICLRLPDQQPLFYLTFGQQSRAAGPTSGPDRLPASRAYRSS